MTKKVKLIRAVRLTPTTKYFRSKSNSAITIRNAHRSHMGKSGKSLSAPLAWVVCEAVGRVVVWRLTLPSKEVSAVP